MITRKQSLDQHLSDTRTNDVLELAAGLVSAYVSNNQVPIGALQSLISSIYSSLTHTGTGPSNRAVSEPTPAVPIKKSVSDEYIICLEDGKKLRTLKRYLRSHYDMSPEEYRAKWRLPLDYPMTAPAYTRIRSHFAKKIGLGRKPRDPQMSRRKLA